MTKPATEMISHLYYEEESKRWIIQSNENHCAGVAEIAGEFAGQIGLYNWGKLLGFMHDRGKEKEDFQRYIKKASGYDINAGVYEDKSHSLSGALLVDKNYKDKCMILPNIIAGHHRGLYDLDSLELMLQKDFPIGVSKEIPNIKLEKPPVLSKTTDLSHLTRFLFSCLTDADYLDTEKFMQPSNNKHRENGATMFELREKLDKWIKENISIPKKPIDKVRQNIQNWCKEQAENKPGFFELTVPTGGGKTISSVVWALNHACKYNKKRIIIAIPYTSIIVQTAEVLRKIFGDDNVLEHHSIVNEDTMSAKTKLLCENWNAPIIVTTNVQLFESMFSNKPGKCRKLHSICNSVLILDEVQNLPLSYLQPIVDSLECYVNLLKVSVLLCTASQPILDGERKGLGPAIFKGICKEIHPIIPSSVSLHENMRRVKIEMPVRPQSIEEIAKKLNLCKKVLCIVNTRKIAKELYSLISKDGEAIHLSRMMCSKHIQDKLHYAQRLLKSDEDISIRIISTQLIEAGVDIDLPIVYRQLAGLDSILQAAGRCNREGKQPTATTHVFELEGHISKGLVGVGIDAMRQMLSFSADSDWFSPKTMNEYFKIYYSKSPTFDKDGIVELTKNPMNISFETIADKFKLIDEKEISVIVNYGQSSELIERIKRYGPSKHLLKQLCAYRVGIKSKLYEDMCKGGLIEEPLSGIYYIPLKEQYDDEIGLKVNNEYQEQTFII